MEEFNIKIYFNIKKIMEKKEINGNEIAEILDESPASICKKMRTLESGRPIKTNTLYKMAQALEVDPVELLK